MRTDISGWTTRLTDEMADRYAASGEWPGITLADRALHRSQADLGTVAVVDGGVAVTFAALHRRGVALASSLRARGLDPGAVISFQLPNWHEALVINLAASIGGYVVNPIVPIYRDAEVGFILADARSRVLFIPDRFRGIDYVALIERLRPDLPLLDHVVLVRARRPDYVAFEDWVEAGTATSRADDLPRTDPDAIKLILYTSGTTGRPKGVLHSHNTLGAEIEANIRFRGLTAADVIFMPSPVTHITGYLYALELPFAAGMTVVLMDRWIAADAVDLMARHGVTFTVGATPFLVELLRELAGRGMTLPALRRFGCGGAPVPPEVIDQARLALPNCMTSRGYGCSEAPTVTMGLVPGDPAELGAVTDGSIYNNRVRIVDLATGKPCAPGDAGEILVDGPEVMLGYADRDSTAEAFDDDGFFRTGDIGYLSHGSYLTISGRKKDIIIRGGENISPKEIEDVLHRHPSIVEAAVIAMPHARMGETPCAFLVLRDGGSIELETVTAFLDDQKLAKQKFPERIIVSAYLPRNAAGKVLKHLLRARLVDASDGAAG